MQMNPPSQNKIQLTNELELDTSNQYTKIINSDYFPKHNIITFFIRHCLDKDYKIDCCNPSQNNGILQIYSATNFKLIKTIPFEHFNKYLIQDENTLLIYQVHAFTKSEQSPYVKFFDLNTLEVVKQINIPLQTRRLWYEQLVHEHNCKCDLVKEVNKYIAGNIKSDCKWQRFNRESKHQFSNVLMANESELIFTFYHPLHNPNEQNFQLWNHKTQQIREVTYSHCLGEIQDGVISKAINLRRVPKSFPQPFFCKKSQRTLHFLLVKAQFSEDNNNYIQGYENTSFVLAEILENEEQIKTQQVFTTSDQIMTYKQQQSVFFLNDTQTHLFVIVNPYTVDVFDFETTKLLRKVKYPTNDKIQKITFFENMFSVLSVEVDHKIRLNGGFENYVGQYINIYQNEVESGKRLNRHTQVLDGYWENTKNFPKNYLFSYKKSQDNDFNILMTSFHQQKKSPHIKFHYYNDLFLFKTPLIENLQVPKIQDFENIQDNQIDWWHTKYICPCGQYLQKNTQFQKQYQQVKAYNQNNDSQWGEYNPYAPYCHLCERQNVYWACSTCQYGICKSCRPEDIRDIQPLTKSNKSNEPYKAKKICPGEQISCTTCNNPIKSEFYFTSNDSKQCLKCNEPEEWLDCRKYHSFQQAPEASKQPCLKCGESQQHPHPLYNCKQCSQTFCTPCMIQNLPSQIFHPQTLRPKCLNNHWLQVHRTSQKDTCLLCPQEDNQIKTTLHFSCKDCKFSLCRNHAPFHEDNIISPNNYKLLLTPNINENKKCPGCLNKMTEEIYKTDTNQCKTQYCENCVNPKPRKVCDKQFLSKFNRQPICPKNHQMGLKPLGCKETCDSCKNDFDKKSFKFSISCNKCNYDVCNKCILLTHDNVRSEEGNLLKFREMSNRDWTCLGCNNSNCPTKNCYSSIEDFPNYYCTNCLDLSAPLLTPEQLEYYVFQLQKLQEKHGEELEFSEGEQDIPLLQNKSENPKQQQQQNKVKKSNKPQKKPKATLEKCLKGHPMSIKLVNQSYIDRYVCEICKTEGPNQYPIHEDDNYGGKRLVGYIIYYCQTCKTSKCSSCTHGFYSEIIPCRNGHKTQFMPKPSQGICGLCKEVAQNLRYICPKSGCEDEKYCTECFPEKSAANKPESKTIEQFQKNEEEQQQNQQQHQQQQQEQKSDHQKQQLQTKNEKKEDIKQKNDNKKQQTAENVQPQQPKNKTKEDTKQKSQQQQNKQQQPKQQEKQQVKQIPQNTKQQKQESKQNEKQHTPEKHQPEEVQSYTQLEQKDTHPMETCPEGHTMSIDIVGEYTIDNRQCFNCKKEGLREKEIKEDGKQNGRSKGFLVYRCDPCRISKCITCASGFYSEIIPCRKGHKTQYIPKPEQGSCQICSGVAKNIQYKCPESQCYRDLYCNLCFPVQSISEKPKQIPATVQVQVKQEELKPQNEDIKEQNLPQEPQLQQNDSHEMETCPQGHIMSINLCGESHIDNKQCFNCKKEGLREREIKEDGKENGRSKGFLTYKCNKCNVYKCLGCTSGFYSEIVPCRQGHKTKLLPQPEQGSCELCTGRAENIQYQCPECYRDKYCTLCFPIKSIIEKPQQVKIIPQQLEEEEKQQEQTKIEEPPQEPQFVQNDSHQMETCPEGHNLAIATIGESYVDDKQCFSCKKQGLRQRLIKEDGKENGRPIGYLAYKCNSCRIFKCLDCTQGSYSEIIPCQKGHKTQLLQQPDQGNCAICKGCAPNIQYQCSECYRDKFCTLCFPLKSIVDKPPPQEQPTLKPQENEPFVQQDSHQMETCPEGHIMASVAINSSYIDRYTCFSCNKQEPKDCEIKEDGKPNGRHIGYLVHKCLKCNIIKCITCTQGFHSEIVPCKKGHKTEFLPIPDRGNCSICTGRAENIQYKCKEDSCYRETYCNLCFPLKTIYQKV